MIINQLFRRTVSSRLAKVSELSQAFKIQLNRSPFFGLARVSERERRKKIAIGNQHKLISVQNSSFLRLTDSPDETRRENEGQQINVMMATPSKLKSLAPHFVNRYSFETRAFFLGLEFSIIIASKKRLSGELRTRLITVSGVPFLRRLIYILVFIFSAYLFTFYRRGEWRRNFSISLHGWIFKWCQVWTLNIPVHMRNELRSLRAHTQAGFLPQKKVLNIVCCFQNQKWH